MGKTKHQPITSRTEDKTTFFYYAFRNISLASLLLLIVSAFILSISHSSATDSNSGADNITLRLSTSCTISSSVISEHSIDLNGGQYGANIGNTKVNAYCNDNNGYSIYAIGSSGNVDGNTDLISDINNSYNIHTGIYDENSSSSLTASSWSMKLIAGTGTGIDSTTGDTVNVTPPTIRNNYDNYNIVPNIYTLVASRASGTNMTTDTTTSGSYFNTTYSIYASSVQPAGTYTGRVKYLMVHPQSNSTTITFDDAFARAGKQKVYQDTNGSYYAMQDMTSDICYSVAFDTSTQLVDIRDNKLYYVTKLKDNNCWMTQNLDLAIGSTNVSLTSENTDISTTASGSGIYTDGYTQNNGVWAWTPDSTATTVSHTISGANVSGWHTDPTAPYSAEGGDTYYYTSNSTADDIKYTSLSACVANHAKSECEHYHIGNYYNWSTSIASNDSSNISADNATATNSICPKGWRLPTYSNTNDFGNLLYAQSIATAPTSNIYTQNGFNLARIAPVYLVRAGGIFDNVITFQWGGLYISNTLKNSTHANQLSFNYNYFVIKDASRRGSGFSIRCLAR